MNIRRGLFRLWLVLTAIWIALVAALSWQSVASPFLPKRAFVFFPEIDAFTPAESGYPNFPGYSQYQFPNSLDVYSKEPLDEDARAEMAEAFLARHVVPRNPELFATRMDNLQFAAAAAAGPPLAVLIVGGALVWALSGFARSSR